MKYIYIITIIISFFILNKESKATIIHLTPDNASSHNYCSTSSLDTFIINLPIGFSTSQWYVNFSSNSNGDSLIFIPTTTGQYMITCVWNGMGMGTVINIFDTPPTNGNFTVFNGGFIDTANNIITECGTNGVYMGASGISGLSIITMEWYGPNSFYSTSNPITAYDTGTYILKLENTCGVAYDSINVISVPLILPEWPDTSFCNSTVSLTLDAGAGWNTYNWNTNQNSQIIKADSLITNTAVTYQLIANNICGTDTSSFIIEQRNYPIPNLSQFNITTPFCNDSVLNLNPAPGFNYSTYSWLWNNGSSSNSNINITGDSLTGSGIYNVSVTMGSKCAAFASDSFAFYDDPEKISMCIVTIDTSGSILIGWHKNEVVDSYNIYRLSGNNIYQLVGTTSYYDPPQWYDTIVDPSASAFRYKVTAVHQYCLNEGPKSYFNSSIHVSYSINPNGGYELTITDRYIDESNFFNPSLYYILIDSMNNGNLSIIDSLSTVFNSYYISNTYIGSTYSVGVKLPFNCLAAKGTKSNSSLAISNKSSIVTSLMQSKTTKNIVNIFPNPTTGIIQIKSKYIINEIKIYNTLGKLVLVSKAKNNINLSNYPNGIYYAKIQTKFGYATKTIILK